MGRHKILYHTHLRRGEKRFPACSGVKSPSPSAALIDLFFGRGGEGAKPGGSMTSRELPTLVNPEGEKGGKNFQFWLPPRPIPSRRKKKVGHLKEKQRGSIEMGGPRHREKKKGGGRGLPRGREKNVLSLGLRGGKFANEKRWSASTGEGCTQIEKRM